MHTVGVIGGSGYAGAELLRLGAGHPALDVAWATGESQAGTAVADLYPSLAPAYGDATFQRWQPELAEGVDLIFCALPHGASQRIVPDLIDRGVPVVDLGADFRLWDADLYPQWYGEAHSAPGLLGKLAYGLPELFRDEIVGAPGVAAPGCYPTAAALALAPLVREVVIEPKGVIVDAASGISGAGRPPKDHTTFGSANEDFTAYGLLDHRHTPEIEQATGAQVLFTPHLAPMTRGILATCYARPTTSTSATSTAVLIEILADFYRSEPFVTVGERSPSTKATAGSNSCHITARYDERTGYVMVISALDNLVKGASGQAIQCANLLLGLPEGTGLTTTGVYP
jgi:N-acetyl-gamma-glutamyl-phosphate reductase